MNSALVTGGSDGIGSQLILALMSRGDWGRVLNNFSTGKRENLSGVKGCQEHNFVYVGDVAHAILLEARIPPAAVLATDVRSNENVNIKDRVKTLSCILSDASAPQFASPWAGDIYLSQSDPSCAEKVLGDHAQVSMTGGLAEKVGWMQT